MKPLTGVQRYAREMLRGLHSVGFKDLVVLAPPCCTIDEIHGYPIIHDPFRFSWSGQWWLWEQLRLPRLLLGYPDHVLWSPSNIGPLIVRKQVVTIHDALVFAGARWFSFAGRTYYQQLLPRLANRILHVITDSTYSQEELIKYGIVLSRKISVVPLGVSSDFFYESSRDSERTYVVNLGSRDPRKNVKGLIAAWNKIDPLLKKGYRLGIVGGNIRGVMAEGINSTRLPDVDFFGYLSDAELRKLFGRSAFFVYPSFYEGFGLPPLEAMASGLPVISSDTTSLPEVCGDAVLYVDPHNEEDIAAKITLLLGDMVLRQQYRKKSLERAKQFTWERSAQRLLEVFSHFCD